jgi:hypothetical protein
VALAFVFPAPAQADGIIVPEPPICDPGPCLPIPCPGPHPCPPHPPIAQLAIRYHRVEVTIDDQIAVTHVDQVFYNPNDWQVEGTYLFPLPADAVVTAFTLWVDGEPVEGKILDAEQLAALTRRSSTACATRRCWNIPDAVRCRRAFSPSRLKESAALSWNTARF